MKPILIAAAFAAWMLTAVAFTAGTGAVLAQSTPTAPAPPVPQPVLPPAPEPDPAFKAAACKGKPDGIYCGVGSNHQQKYQCTNNNLAAQWPCPGGCEQATLECKQSTGVRVIDKAPTGSGARQ